MIDSNRRKVITLEREGGEIRISLTIMFGIIHILICICPLTLRKNVLNTETRFVIWLS